jgi:HAD superfamily hydrolase (TIGR01509 family)
MDPIEASAILFDMDGLLVDSEPLWADVETEFALARGGDFTPEMAHACVGRGLANTLRVMHEAFGFAVDVERDSHDIVERFVTRAGELALKPGALALLDEAAGRVPTALGSSSSRRLVTAALEAVGVASRFQVVVAGDEVDRPKPAPDIFLRCARLLDVAPDRCVVLEDSLAGVRAGRAAGMRVIAVPEGDGRDLAGECDAVASDLFDARRRMRFARYRAPHFLV